MYDLSRTSMIAFEVGTDCNMKQVHRECPIHYRKNVCGDKVLTEDSISECMQQANALQFTGYYAFHLFNEPMLQLDLILRIIDRNTQNRYLLWTNGSLLHRTVRQNEFLKKFHLVCITCYNLEDRPFFESLQDVYGNIQIFDGVMDDRQNAYTRDHTNRFACKKPLFELIVDHYGNIVLCAFDYNNTHTLGNVFLDPFGAIVRGERYQCILQQAHKRILDMQTCPEICKRCNEPWLKYPHYFR